MDFVNRLAGEFKLRPQQVQAAVELLDAGNTIPFIARYRKEATGSLDDQVLREMAERLEYLRNLEKRREEIASSLEEQGVMTDELKAQLAKAVPSFPAETPDPGNRGKGTGTGTSCPVADASAGGRSRGGSGQVYQ